jgi:hypothetical protein
MPKRRSVSEDWQAGYRYGLGEQAGRDIDEYRAKIDALRAENGLLQLRLKEALARADKAERDLKRAAKRAAAPRGKTPRGQTPPAQASSPG